MEMLEYFLSQVPESSRYLLAQLPQNFEILGGRAKLE
jgi:hypothetical protein